MKKSELPEKNCKIKVAITFFIFYSVVGTEFHIGEPLHFIDGLEHDMLLKNTQVQVVVHFKICKDTLSVLSIINIFLTRDNKADEYFSSKSGT